jgi:hypothetical protein
VLLLDPVVSSYSPLTTKDPSFRDPSSDSSVRVVGLQLWVRFRVESLIESSVLA